MGRSSFGRLGRPDGSDGAAPADQASGLRRLFGSASRALLTVAANPFVPGAQVLLETLSAGLVLQGRRVLVVDAAATSPRPTEGTLIDLAAGIERLDDPVSYLAARGLPMAYVDACGSASAFIDAARSAAPDCDTVLLHAEAMDLMRMLGHGPVRPLLLAADRPESVKHAYACCKLLVQRCSLMSFDLVLSAQPRSERLVAIAERLASCAETFLGALVQDSVVIDPVFDPQAARDVSLARLLTRQLADHHAPGLLRVRAPSAGGDIRAGSTFHPL